MENKPNIDRKGQTGRFQLSFPGMSLIEDALKSLAVADTEERGAVFTRREVVEFILDLVGYTADKPLYESRFLEPSFGEGEFLLVAVKRMVEAWKRGGEQTDCLACFGDSIRAVELHKASFTATRRKIVSLLAEEGISPVAAERLADRWFINGDFLLTPLEEGFDYVAGNPPYLRQEMIPPPLIAEYRLHYETIFDRADLYVPFIERSLSLIGENGVLGFICSNRWMKNRYGKRLRKMIADGYHLRTYVDMVDTPAFEKNVLAYPAITIIGKEKADVTRAAYRPEISGGSLRRLAGELLAKDFPGTQSGIRELTGVATGSEPWILESCEELALVRRLEQNFPVIEETGCRVGIGVATGADKVFIGQYDELDLEPDRKLRLVTTQDISSGEVRWGGLGVVNPFADGGGLVNLEEYPKLSGYLERHREEIVRRHVARKASANWYRTVDRIYPEIAGRPKLLIPDIKGEAHIVYENGGLYPHHNLYFITSDEWNLKALQGVLLSGVAGLFVSIYSTQMRSGYLRFQAQYLRRIRLPHWRDVSDEIKHALIDSAERKDIDTCREATFKLYGLSKKERAVLISENA